jgi:hypothetical protein
MPHPKMTAVEVKEAIWRRHGCFGGSGEWVCINEAFSGFASMGGGIDVFAIGVWSTAKAKGLPGAGKHPHRNVTVAYEVKVSRADFRREVNGYEPGSGCKWNTRAVPPWPNKAYWALERSNYFMFATPAGLLTPEEIGRRKRPEDGGLWLPPEAGLIEVTGTGCIVRELAPLRECRPLTTHETAELIRHAIDPAKQRAQRAGFAA